MSDILKNLVKQLSPRTGALVGDVPSQPMNPEIIFDRPIVADDDFLQGQVNKTFEEIANDQEFVERFEVRIGSFYSSPI